MKEENKEKKGTIITTSNIKFKKQKERDTFLSTSDLPEVLPKPGFAVEKEAEKEEEENEEK